ncbi:putative quinol monooxygenase [Kordiimonas marina]|uniref:putative quinol monooxygenase n=1 Tax=Kordiimonas marina TaxID=2872312 RepID=UPI001FF5D617|nr:DUF4286 family protein [Kordiimonas marina]MCJ9428365.1 antibiotic biosynthesis monooxygenase [Kordiimonas marina]
MSGLLYSVRVWVDPERGEDYIAWLTGGHVAEIAGEPGVLWAHLARLDEPDADGWVGFRTLYGFESRAAFDAYQNGDLYKSFAPAWQQYAGLFRIERETGPLLESHGSDGKTEQ